MTINKLNYEIYALDYLEGTLSPALRTEMEAFLQQHPDIAADFEAVALYRPLTAPAPATYPKAAQLRKPFTATWRRYTHWIAPIGISALFMMAYPYWFHRTQSVATETPLEASSPAALRPSPSASAPVRPSATGTSVAPSPSEIRTNAASLRPARLSANAAPSPVTALAREGGPAAGRPSPAEVLLDLGREPRRSIGLVAADAIQDVAPHRELIAIAAVPQALAPRYGDLAAWAPHATSAPAPQLESNAFAPTTFAERPQWVLYAAPLSVGIDLRKVAAQDEAPMSSLRIPIDETGAVRLGTPITAAMGVQYRSGQGWYAGLGVELTQRSLEYVPMAGSDLNVLALDVAYRMWSMPLALGYRRRIGMRGALEWEAGVAMTLMGRRGYEPVLSGAAGLEAPRSYDVFNTPMLAGKLLVVADVQRIVPTWHTQLTYAHGLRNGSELAFSVGYGQQLGVVNRVRVWDYDFGGQYRSGVTAFDMRFATLRAGVAYRHPLVSVKGR